MIISRCEACSSKQSIGIALADAIGVSLGFMLALGSVATVREILGMGSWFGLAVLPEAFPKWGLMVMPPGAFLTLGGLLALVTWMARRRAEHQAAEPVGEH